MGKIFKALKKASQERSGHISAENKENKNDVKDTQNTKGKKSDNSSSNNIDLGTIHNILRDRSYREMIKSEKKGVRGNNLTDKTIGTEKVNKLQNKKEYRKKHENRAITNLMNKKEFEVIDKHTFKSRTETDLKNYMNKKISSNNSMAGAKQNVHRKINGLKQQGKNKNNISKNAQYGVKKSNISNTIINKKDFEEQNIKSNRGLSNKLAKPSVSYSEIALNTNKTQNDLASIHAKTLDFFDFDSVDPYLITLRKPRSFASEQFKLLRTSVLFPIKGEAPKIILVTSAHPGDGKSFIASNLAICFALNIDKRVLLVDADIRKPEIHKRFGIYGSEGLSEFLNKNRTLEGLLKRTPLKNLTILPGGKPPKNPSELLSSEKMPTLFNELSSRYHDRYVIIDSPPPKITSDTCVIARHVDAILIVVRAGHTNKRSLEDIITLLGKEKIIGIVMNNYKDKSSRYYGYSGYKKQSKYIKKYFDEN